jgi:hypothetical protein
MDLSLEADLLIILICLVATAFGLLSVDKDNYIGEMDLIDIWKGAMINVLFLILYSLPLLIVIYGYGYLIQEGY